ncbi:hypothetical protein [Desulfatirhabdium butyrativorans]|uniref:hypothetical protein n=1 Tax=Desulfatirhabdium butyrativorans TaxID=340467 RepID=UPI0012EC2838|nr:hypothetical protein [Desulfatirhabdium butyrativorans]
MAELYAEGRKANYDTADEIIERLKKKNNFIPSSVTAHREYSFVLLQEYRRFIQERSQNGR